MKNKSTNTIKHSKGHPIWSAGCIRTKQSPFVHVRSTAAEGYNGRAEQLEVEWQRLSWKTLANPVLENAWECCCCC